MREKNERERERDGPEEENISPGVNLSPPAAFVSGFRLQFPPKGSGNLSDPTQLSRDEISPTRSLPPPSLSLSLSLLLGFTDSPLSSVRPIAFSVRLLLCVLLFFTRRELGEIYCHVDG